MRYGSVSAPQINISPAESLSTFEVDTGISKYAVSNMQKHSIYYKVYNTKHTVYAVSCYTWGKIFLS